MGACRFVALHNFLGHFGWLACRTRKKDTSGLPSLDAYGSGSLPVAYMSTATTDILVFSLPNEAMARHGLGGHAPALKYRTALVGEAPSSDVCISSAG